MAWKKSCLILSGRSDFHAIDNQSIAVYDFARRILTSISVDETLLSRYVNISTYFRGLSLHSFNSVHVLANSACFSLCSRDSAGASVAARNVISSA